MKNIIFILLLFVFSGPANAVIKTWTKIYGSKAGSSGFAVACDSKNNIYVAGRTMGTFDGQKHIGVDDACLTKFSPDGKKIWTKIWGTSKDDGCYAVAVDENDNIFVGGYAGGAFDGQTFNGEKDCFIIKFSSAGEKIWTKLFGTIDFDYIYSIAVDKYENIFVAGTTWGAFNGFTNQGWEDIFVAKLNPSGEIIWLDQFGSDHLDSAEKIAVNSSGDLIVCGGVGSFDSFFSTGSLDFFLRCYSENGTVKWTKLWGSTGFDLAYSLAFGSNDDIYVVGWAGSSIDGFSSAGEGDFYLAKFSANGTKLFSKLWGSAEEDWLKDIIYDKENNKIFVFGASFGDINLQKLMGRCDLYFADLGNGTNIISEILWGGDERDYAGKMCKDRLNNIYTVGETFGGFDGQKDISGKDAPNIFVSAFNSKTNLDVISVKGKIKPGKFNAKIFHNNPVESFYNGELIIALNNITNVFSGINGEWKWNKKGTNGKFIGASKIKIKGANPQKRKIILKISNTEINGMISNIWIDFSNGQSEEIHISPNENGKF